MFIYQRLAEQITKITVSIHLGQPKIDWPVPIRHITLYKIEIIHFKTSSTIEPIPVITYTKDTHINCTLIPNISYGKSSSTSNSPTAKGSAQPGNFSFSAAIHACVICNQANSYQQLLSKK